MFMDDWMWWNEVMHEAESTGCGEHEYKDCCLDGLDSLDFDDEWLDDDDDEDLSF